MLELNKDILLVIFEELEDTRQFLFSCLLVNRIWCEIVIPILWRNPLKSSNRHLVNIIASHLPEESRSLLSDHGINISYRQHLLFDYVSFCKYIETSNVKAMVDLLQLCELNCFLFEQEIYKLFISRCSSLKCLSIVTELRHPIYQFPGANNSLSELHELKCSALLSETYYFGLALICKSIQRMNVWPIGRNNEGLISLIAVQRNLRHFNCINDREFSDNQRKVNQALMQNANKLLSFKLRGDYYTPIDIITEFVSLRKLDLSNFKQSKMLDGPLSKSTYPNLRVFKIYKSSIHALATVIENTEGYLKKFLFYSYYHVTYSGELIRSIYDNCPKIKLLTVVVNEVDYFAFENLLTTCQDLEGLMVKGDDETLEKSRDGDRILQILLKSAPPRLHKLRFGAEWYFSLDAWKTFLEGWKGRPALCISVLERKFIKSHSDIIKNYRKEGTVKKFNEIGNVFALSMDWKNY